MAAHRECCGKARDTDLLRHSSSSAQVVLEALDAAPSVLGLVFKAAYVVQP